MIKNRFFDVDGTLLKLGSKVPSFQTVQTLQQLQAKDLTVHGDRQRLPLRPTF